MSQVCVSIACACHRQRSWQLRPSQETVLLRRTALARLDWYDIACMVVPFCLPADRSEPWFRASTRFPPFPRDGIDTGRQHCCCFMRGELKRSYAKANLPREQYLASHLLIDSGIRLGPRLPYRSDFGNILAMDWAQCPDTGRYAQIWKGDGMGTVCYLAASPGAVWDGGLGTPKPPVAGSNPATPAMR